MNQPHSSINSQLLFGGYFHSASGNKTEDQPLSPDKKKGCGFFFFLSIYRAQRWININILVCSCSVQKTLIECLNSPKRTTSALLLFFFKGEKNGHFLSGMQEQAFSLVTLSVSVAGKHIVSIQSPTDRASIFQHWSKSTFFPPFAISLKIISFTYLLFVLYSLILSKKSF